MNAYQVGWMLAGPLLPIIGVSITFLLSPVALAILWVVSAGAIHRDRRDAQPARNACFTSALAVGGADGGFDRRIRGRHSRAPPGDLRCNR